MFALCRAVEGAQRAAQASVNNALLDRALCESKVMYLLAAPLFRINR